MPASFIIILAILVLVVLAMLLIQKDKGDDSTIDSNSENDLERLAAEIKESAAGTDDPFKSAAGAAEPVAVAAEDTVETAGETAESAADPFKSASGSTQDTVVEEVSEVVVEAEETVEETVSEAADTAADPFKSATSSGASDEPAPSEEPPSSDSGGGDASDPFKAPG